MNIKVGDFVVTVGRFGCEAKEAIKVTAKIVFWHDEHYNCPFRVRMEDVVFAGPQSEARRLAAQLTSSRQQQFDEERNSRARRIGRDRKLIEAATATLKAETADKMGSK